MVRIIGWINIILILFMIAIYPIKYLYLKSIRESKTNYYFKKAYNIFKRFHPIIGLIIIIFGLYHGYKLYSLTIIYTGTILLYSIFLNGFIALIGQKLKMMKKHWRKAHRIMALFIVIFALLHLISPNII